jgi:hypothetical protein
MHIAIAYISPPTYLHTHTQQLIMRRIRESADIGGY